MATLEAWYKFENDLTDSADGNDLTEQTSGDFSTTIFKRGAYSRQHDGTGYDQKAAVVGGLSSGDADFSGGGWFYASNVDTDQAVFGLGITSGDANTCYWPLITSSTNIRIDLASDTLDFTVPAMSNSTWYHLWCQYTASTNTSDLYLNNVQSSSGAQAHAGARTLGATFHINIGADPDGNSKFTGNLDDFRFYNGVTTAAERELIFNSFRPRVILF